jgi:hypothetical protein
VFTNSMGETRTTTATPRRRTAYVLAFAALCAALVAAIAIPSAGARDVKVLGKTKHTPRPACPNLDHPSRCKAIGRVTGFMTVADGRKHPFRVKEDGKLVAWALDVSKPANTKKNPQRNSFGGLFKNKEFGEKPTARIAVIKHKGGVSYKLLRQSPTVALGGVLGQKEVFTLKKPLTVRKGNIVAFTSPTWTPNFAQRHLEPSENKWRASRRKNNCGPKDNSDEAKVRFARKSHAHQNKGSERDYECLYTHGRIIYWAYVVPNK